VTGAVVWVPPETTAEQLRFLPDDATVRVVPGDAIPEHPGRGDILIPHVGPVRRRELLQRLDGLRVVQTLSAGVDGILGDIPDGVALCDARGVHDISVSEWVVAAILAMQRELPVYVRDQANCTWKPAERSAREVHGMRVLILGHGSIGQAVARRLQPFGATVTGIALHPRQDARGIEDLDALLPDADALVVLLPLTDRTRGIIDARYIERMKPGALLVNAGRGGVADTQAIAAAVQRGRIRAALDVVDPEPLPAEHPLWRAGEVLLTPHIAGTTDGFLDRAWRFVGEQVRRYIDGEPLLNVVREGY
jgi:phosphoglycerate dehydrogenase-like enzyme